MLFKFPTEHPFGNTYAGLIFEAKDNNGQMVVTGVTEECEPHLALFNKQVVLSRAQDLLDELTINKSDNVLMFREDRRKGLQRFAEKWQADVARRRAK